MGGQRCRKLFQWQTVRKAKFRCNFQHGLDHKGTIAQPWMWHREASKVELLIIVKQDIQIQRTWSPVTLSYTPVALLQCLKLIQQRQRR